MGKGQRCYSWVSQSFFGDVNRSHFGVAVFPDLILYSSQAWGGAIQNCWTLLWAALGDRPARHLQPESEWKVQPVTQAKGLEIQRYVQIWTAVRQGQL